MILTGNKIREETKKGNIILEPFEEKMLNPNSFNYRLGRFLKKSYINNKNELKFQDIDLFQYPNGYTLIPGHLYLGSTFEIIGSEVYAMSLIGRSSIGRYGLFLQISANLGHTTSCHCWTLEILPVLKIKVYYKMCIGQVSFWNNLGIVEKTDHKYNKFNIPTEGGLK